MSDDDPESDAETREQIKARMRAAAAGGTWVSAAETRQDAADEEAAEREACEDAEVLAALERSRAETSRRAALGLRTSYSMGEVIAHLFGDDEDQDQTADPVVPWVEQLPTEARKIFETEMSAAVRAASGEHELIGRRLAEWKRTAHLYAAEEGRAMLDAEMFADAGANTNMAQTMKSIREDAQEIDLEPG